MRGLLRRALKRARSGLLAAERIVYPGAPPLALEVRMKTSRFALLALLGPAIAGACSASVTGNTNASSSTTGTGGSTTTSSTGTGTGGAPVVDAGPDVVSSEAGGPCTFADDCAGISDVCNVGTCINGACARTPANDFGTCDD